MSRSLPILAPSKFDRWIVRDGLSLKFDRETPPRVFREAWRALIHAHKRVQFYLGDAINFAADRHQQGRYTEFIEESGLDYQTLAAYSQVARSIPPERRRTELGFSHHLAVRAF
jgi:hypothetical protein